MKGEGGDKVTLCEERNHIASDKDPSIPNWSDTRHVFTIDTDNSRERHINAGTEEDGCESQDDSLKHEAVVAEGIVVAKSATEIPECFEERTEKHCDTYGVCISWMVWFWEGELGKREEGDGYRMAMFGT